MKKINSRFDILSNEQIKSHQISSKFVYSGFVKVSDEPQKRDVRFCMQNYLQNLTELGENTRTVQYQH